MAWNDRFKKAQSEKNRAKAVEEGRAVTQEQIDRAKSVDMKDYLQSQGFEVKRDGARYFTALRGKEEYRLTRPDDSQPWLWCDKYAHGADGGKGEGGRIIDLAKKIGSDGTFVGAVRALAGGSYSTHTTHTKAAPQAAPEAVLELDKPTEQDRAAGRAYLQHERGISAETLDEAEKQGFLSYEKGAVLFIGRDAAGRAGNATARRCNPQEGELSKQSKTGSRKFFAGVLHGNEQSAWIVEGGTDALALRDLSIKNSLEPPTIIISDGVGVRTYLDNPSVLNTLKKADSVIIAGENEKDAETQEKTDAARAVLAERIKTAAGKEAVGVWYPPQGVKDMAELNKSAQRSAGAQVNSGGKPKGAAEQEHEAE